MADKFVDGIERIVIDLLYYANDTNDKKMAYTLREGASLIQVFVNAFRNSPSPSPETESEGDSNSKH